MDDVSSKLFTSFIVSYFTVTTDFVFFCLETVLEKITPMEFYQWLNEELKCTSWQSPEDLVSNLISMTNFGSFEVVFILSSNLSILLWPIRNRIEEMDAWLLEKSFHSFRDKLPSAVRRNRARMAKPGKYLSHYFYCTLSWIAFHYLDLFIAAEVIHNNK